MSLQVKALYRVKELAEMSGIQERTLRRWIDRQKMSIRIERSVLIPLAGFRDAFPQVWESIRIRQSLKPSNCEACGGALKP